MSNMPYNYSSYKPSIVDVAVDTVTFSAVGYGLEKLKATGKLRLQNIGAFLAADLIVRWSQYSPQMINNMAGFSGPLIWEALLSSGFSVLLDYMTGHEEGAILNALIRNAANIPFQLIVDKIIAEK